LFVLQQVCLAHWSTQYQRWRLHQWHSSLVVQVRWHFKLRFLRTGQHRVLYTVLITGRRGHDCMEVEFTTTCTIVPKATKVVNSNPAHGEVYSIQHYVINFVSDLSERNHRSPKARREKNRRVHLCKNSTIRRPNIMRRVTTILHSPLSTNLTK
jgi:hypothetical protein